MPCPASVACCKMLSPYSLLAVVIGDKYVIYDTMYNHKLIITIVATHLTKHNPDMDMDDSYILEYTCCLQSICVEQESHNS